MSGLNIQRLREVLDTVYDAANGALKTSGGASATQRTASIITTSTSGTIALGAKSIAIANTGAAAGTVNGVSISTGISLSWDAPDSDTLGAVAYNATGTTFLITEMR